MFLHARKGHVEPLGKGCDRSVRPPELLQNAASGGVRERAERGIEVGLTILYHVVQYTISVTVLQWEAERPLRCPGDPPKLTINDEGMRRLVHSVCACACGWIVWKRLVAYAARREVNLKLENVRLYNWVERK